jgi:predicted Fe-Mo cluster-binding NifX family protein
MAIALAASQDHIAAFFDSADSLVVIDARVAGQRRVEAMPAGMTATQMQAILRSWNVKVILCGVIPTITKKSIEEAGIMVIPFLRGKLVDVETGFFSGRLDEPIFYLPGCHRGWNPPVLDCYLSAKSHMS